MRRESGGWPVRNEYSRPTWINTPVTLPCVDLGMLATARLRRRRRAKLVLLGLLLALAVALAMGCGS